MSSLVVSSLVIKPKIHKNLKNQKTKKLLLWKEPLVEQFIKYRESKKGKGMRTMLKELDKIAKILLKRHDINCCSKQGTKHLKFQCVFSEEILLAKYHRNNYIHLGFEEVEQFVSFMGASEILAFMSENYETCVACHELKDYVSSIFEWCIKTFSNNCYIVDYKERHRDAQDVSTICSNPWKKKLLNPKAHLMKKRRRVTNKRRKNGFYPCPPSKKSNSLSLTLPDCPPCLPKEDECYDPVDSLEISTVSEACDNDYALVIYDNPCYFDKSYDNPLFELNFEMHGTKEFCLENVYEKALDDGPILVDNIGGVLTLWSPLPLESDQLSCYKIVKSGNECFNPTIFELDKNHVFVDHEKHALCDSYIVEFVHGATENYYERGKYWLQRFSWY